MAEGLGVVNGIGNTLFELMAYDDSAQPVTTTLADYLLPTISEVPSIKVELVEFPSTKNPFGVKVIGEAGTVPAAGAIVSGIEDALHGYGITIGETPITPARLAELIRASSSVAHK